MNLSVMSTDEIYVTLEDVGDTIVPPLMSCAPLGPGASTKDNPAGERAHGEQGHREKGTGRLVRFVVRLLPPQEPGSAPIDVTVPVAQEHQRIEWPRP